MDITHTRLHFIDQEGNDKVVYPESLAEDVKVTDDKTLKEYLDGIGELAFKDSVESTDVPINASSNIFVPSSVLNLADLVRSFGKNAFSSGTTATRAVGDEDGNNIKETYLKKTDADEKYLTKIETESWIRDGRIHSTPDSTKLYLLGSSNPSDNTEVAKKNPSIFIEGNTLTAPVVNGLASSAKFAETSTNATNDGNGNNISSTYLKNEEFAKEMEKYILNATTATWKVTDENVTTENSVSKFFIAGSQDQDSSTGKLTKNPHIYAQGSTLTAPFVNGISDKANKDKNGNDIVDTYFKKEGGVINTNPTITNDVSTTAPDNALITKKYLKDSINDVILGDISAFVNAMTFKGTVGSEVADVQSLPTENVLIGYTYKVIGDGITVLAESSSTGEAFTAKNGDLVTAVTKTPTWTLIPSGDEPVLYLRYSTTESNLTDSFATGQIILGEAAIKQIATVVGDTGNLITDSAVKKELEYYATKKELELVSLTDNKVETAPTTGRIFLVGSTQSDTVTSKLGKSTTAYVEDGSLHIPQIVSSLQGTATWATLAAQSTKAAQDINGNPIHEFYASTKSVEDALKNYISVESTSSWAVTDRNVASVVGSNKMYIVGSENAQTNTNILQKNQNLYYENGTLYSGKFSGTLEGKASSASMSDESEKARTDSDGNVFSEYYVAKKDTSTWDVSQNEDTHVTNTVSVDKIYLTGSASSASATETQLKNQNIYAHGSTLTAPMVEGDVLLKNVVNENISHDTLSGVLNSLGSMAFKDSESSLNPEIVYVFDGGSPADLMEQEVT